MVLERDVRGFLAQHAEHFAAYAGIVPPSIIATLIYSETGGDRFAVSRDPVLIECGLSQAPLYRFADEDLDPFDAEGGIWLRCRDFNADAAWLMDEYGRIFYEPSRSLWLGCVLRYSIGKRSLEKVIASVEAWRRARLAKDLVVGPDFEADCAAWAKTDLPHRIQWGRQSSQKIAERVGGKKHRRRLDVAEAIDGLRSGCFGSPPATRPAHMPDLPRELDGPCLVARKAYRQTSAENAANLARVRAYATQARRRARASKAPLTWRVGKALARAIGDD